MAVVVIGAQPAAAATEFGDDCTGDEISGGIETASYFSLTAPGNTLPLAAPVDGVITEWIVDSEIAGIVPQTLKVFRPTPANTVQIVGESPAGIATGLNFFETRIPVRAGDRLGFTGGPPKGILFCEMTPVQALAGAFLGAGSGIGSTQPYTEVDVTARFPITALIEPDADNDGHGDETQDGCPQSAGAQGACPPPPPPPAPPAPVKLNASAASNKGMITVLITSDAQTSVTVTGSAKLGKAKAAKLNGGTQLVAPGVLAKFLIPVPRAVTRKLKQLGPKRSLSVNLTATAPNASGSPTVTTLKAKLRGQAKPKPKRPKGQRS